MNMKTAPHGLGRGLGALLGDELENTKAENPAGGAVELSLNDIDVNREQPRKRFDEEELEDLAASIASVGVIQPIVVVRNGTRYTIVAGERRFRASRLAGKSTIPAIVKEWDEITRVKAALIENLQRADLNPVETAMGMKDLMEKCGLTQEELAGVVGKSRSAVANTLRLLNLEPGVLEMLQTGKLTAGHARALVTVPAEKQQRLAQQCAALDLSVRQFEKLCARADEEPQAAEKPVKTPEMKKLENMGREVFGVKTRIEGSESRGKVVLSYTSADELESIWNALSRMSE